MIILWLRKIMHSIKEMADFSEYYCKSYLLNFSWRWFILYTVLVNFLLVQVEFLFRILYVSNTWSNYAYTLLKSNDLTGDYYILNSIQFLFINVCDMCHHDSGLLKSDSKYLFRTISWVEIPARDEIGNFPKITRRKLRRKLWTRLRRHELCECFHIKHGDRFDESSRETARISRAIN